MARLKQITLALDAFGGDHAPLSVIEGAAAALKRYPALSFQFYGDEQLIAPLLKQHPALQTVSQIFHTTETIKADEKPSQAVRKGRNSSMGLAIQAVRERKADGVVSAGNTGALMAMSKLMLGTLEGIDRPAIASLFPTIRSECVMLDLGANIECTAQQLFQFAVMGDAFARAILGLQKPQIGLLNIGSEEMKGHEEIRQAAEMLQKTNLPLNYIGYIEGDAIGQGKADVVVADGFSGNIALKSAEGTGKLCSYYLKEAFKSGFVSKVGGLLARAALMTLFAKLDPRRHNGAMFLGLNGIVVKSHGGADSFSFSNAVSVAAELISHHINAQIIQEIKLSGAVVG